MTKVTLMLFGAALSLAGSVALWCNAGATDAYFEEVARTPIELRNGATADLKFRVLLEAQYLIYIDVQRVLSTDKIDGLLGITFGRESTAPYAAWQLKEGGTQVAAGPDSGSVSSGRWGESIGKLIGIVRCAPGKDYTLHVEVMQTVPELSGADPSVSITTDPLVLQGIGFTGAVLRGLGSALALLSVLLCLGTLRARRALGR